MRCRGGFLGGLAAAEGRTGFGTARRRDLEIGSGPTGNDHDDIETTGYWYLEGGSRLQHGDGIVVSSGAVGTAENQLVISHTARRFGAVNCPGFSGAIAAERRTGEQTMKLRTLALLSISGFALAACSGGHSDSARGAPEVGSETTASAAQALQEVTESLSHGWALSRPPFGTVTVKPIATAATFERFPRAEASDFRGTGTAAEDRLQIPQDGVRYASGKTMFVPGGSGTIEELPLRALTIRSATQGSVSIQGDDGTDPVYDPATRLATNNSLSSTDGKLFYSAEVTEDGLVLKMGGNGGNYDMQRRFDIGEDADDWYGRGPDGVRGTEDDGTTGSDKWDGCYTDLPDATADCTNWNSDDLKVTFGRPSVAPHGHYAWYWNTRVPLPPGASADDANIKAKFDRSYIEIRDLGSYELWMTNLARIDKGLEDAGGPPFRRDDQAQFLSHAAYGLLLYNDNLVSWKAPSRLTAFHFGFDAFADSEDAKTTDIENAVSATFKGTTMAQMSFHLTGPHVSRPLRIDLRGDIVLSANIGGSDGGTISGVISGFEMLGPDRTWHPHSAIIDPKKQERIVLAGTNYKSQQTNGVFSAAAANYAAYGATIKADGSYEGGVYLQYYDDSDSRWKDKTTKFDTYVTADYSVFGGTFYGPTGDDLSGLETAGRWYLAADASCTNGRGGCTNQLLRTGPVYGSFGAAQ